MARARDPEIRPTLLARAAQRLAAFSGSLLAGVALVAGALGGAVLLEACGADSSDSTGGHRVTLHTRLEMAEGGAEFVTAAGWSVKLDKVALQAGPFYYFDGAPPLALRSTRGHSEVAQRWLGLGIAHAHPGHYEPGNALGQMLESSFVDLLEGAVTLPDGDGITGTYRSARFGFYAPGTLGAAGVLAVAVGVAEKEGEAPRAFRASAMAADIAKTATEGHVDGCEFDEVTVESDGTVTVVVAPHVWFELVDFSLVEPGTSEEPSTFAEGSQPHVAFTQGLAQLSAYHFSYSAD